jgi:hypothetical protein
LRFGKRGAVTAAFFTAAIALVGHSTELGLSRLMIRTNRLFTYKASWARFISERMRAEERIEVRDAASRIVADLRT